MYKQNKLHALLVALAFGLSIGLSGCGGGGSSSPANLDGGNSGGGGTGGGDGGGGTGGTGGGDGGGGTGGGDGGAGFSGVEGPLDPVQIQLSEIVGNQVGSALPDPLGGTVMCADEAVEALVDAPDALLAAFAALPGGADPATAFNGAAADMTATMQVFAAKLQSALMLLAGQGTTCDTSTAGGNPFAGTPLEPIGAPLAALISGLNGVGDGGNGGDPNLTVVVATITPLLDQLEAGFTMVPAELQGAPIVGGVLATVQDAIGDLSSLLTAAGGYDPVATQAAIENLLDNVLGNVLLGVIPVGEIDAATGQDFATQIQDGINTLTAEFGAGLGMLITPAFNDGLNGALSPILDPVEGLLSQLIAATDTGNPLDGLLGGLAGDGASPMDSLLALFTAGADGNPLSGLVSSFPGGGAATPLDDILILIDPANADDLDGLLGALSTLFGGTPLGDILDGILGGLGGLYP